MKSMTGYGRAHLSGEASEITVEVRAVNHRYLDVNVKCPRAFGFLEEALKKAAATRIARGKVDIFVQLAVEEQGDVKLNLPLAHRYYEALTTLAQSLELPQDITVMDLAKLPDVIVGTREEVDAKAITESVVGVFYQALDEFDQMRTREGEQMAADVQNRAQTILSLVEQVEVVAPQRVTDYREKLEKRMREVLADTTIDEQRILTEAAIFADRTAVDEETVRLRSHMHQLGIMLADGQPVGRKLDFLVQEMNREANTIGSKSNEAALARIVVELKSEIEKIREQIQNIE